MTPLLALVVIGAGMAGAVVRYLVTRAAPESPWPVLIVNVAGSLVAGLALGLTDAGAFPVEARVALVTGFAGGLTTFSTLSVQTIQLWLDRCYRTVVVSVSANLVVGLGACAAGWCVGLLAGG